MKCNIVKRMLTKQSIPTVTRSFAVDYTDHKKSNLFSRAESSKMKEIREKMRREHHEEVRFITDQSQMKNKVVTGESTYEKQKRESAFKTEMVYASDL